jgi:DNA-binding NarL/FixJ family response regulator
VNIIKKIIIADDHDIVRFGIRILLEQNTKYNIVAETNDVTLIVSVCRTHSPDLLVLDLNFQHGDSLNVLKQLKAEFRDLKVLVYSAYEDIHYVL